MNKRKRGPNPQEADLGPIARNVNFSEQEQKTAKAGILRQEKTGFIAFHSESFPPQYGKNPCRK